MPDTCRLCGSSAPLLKSHVFSQFLYDLSGLHGDGQKHEKYRSFHLTGEDLYNVADRPTGVWENLLCAACEARRGVTENYAREVIELLHSKLGPNPVLLEDVDYAKFRLFGLSLFWMASICTMTELARFSLDPETEERLRQKLLAGDPGEPGSDPILLTALQTEHPFFQDKFENGVLRETWMMPEVLEPGLYRMAVAGLMWSLYEGEQAVGSLLVARDTGDIWPATHQKDGRLPVWRMKKDLTETEIWQAFERLGHQPKGHVSLLRSGTVGNRAERRRAGRRPDRA